MKNPAKRLKPASPAICPDYSGLLQNVSELLEAARSSSPRIVDTSIAHLSIRSTPSNESGTSTPQTVSELIRFAGLARAYSPPGPHSVLLISRGRNPKTFSYSPLGERSGLGKAHQLFGEQLPKPHEELNEVLAA